MIISIKNYLAGSYLLESQPQQWDSIVVLDSTLPEPAFVSEQSKRSLILRFDDIEESVPGKVAPTLADVESALSFGGESE